MPGEPWQITRDMFLSEAEVGRLLRDVRDQSVEADPDNLTPHVDRLVIEILLYSGLRPSEFCRLAVQDAVLADEESFLRVTEGAGEKRIVFIPRWLNRDIARYVKSVRPQYLDAGNG